jgi:hypothetical protein
MLDWLVTKSRQRDWYFFKTCDHFIEGLLQ